MEALPRKVWPATLCYIASFVALSAVSVDERVHIANSRESLRLCDNGSCGLVIGNYVLLQSPRYQRAWLSSFRVRGWSGRDRRGCDPKKLGLWRKSLKLLNNRSEELRIHRDRKVLVVRKRKIMQAPAATSPT